MNSNQSARLLSRDSEDTEIESLLSSLDTLTRPSLDEDEPEQHYDWLLIKRKGIEFGFVDAAYFAGKIRPLWRGDGLILSQLTFYSDTREDVAPYAGELPRGLNFSDTRKVVRRKLAELESTRHSHLTDRWNVDNYRLVVAYKDATLDLEGTVDSVHLKLPIQALPEKNRKQPNIAGAQWLSLFGLHAQSEALQIAVVPLNITERIEEDEDEREVEFIEDCGITLYFEDAKRLKTPRSSSNIKGLVLGAVKFYRARDLDARQYSGELPFDLDFDDSPEMRRDRPGSHQH